MGIEHATTIEAVPATVWHTLTDATEMAVWMADDAMELEVETDWTIGAPIRMRGHHHVPFENTGTVVAVEPMRRLCWTHRSSVSRLADRPGSDATIDIRLAPQQEGTEVTVTVTGYAGRAVGEHLGFYWGVALERLRRHVLGITAV